MLFLTCINLCSHSFYLSRSRQQQLHMLVNSFGAGLLIECGAYPNVVNGIYDFFNKVLNNNGFSLIKL